MRAKDAIIAWTPVHWEGRERGTRGHVIVVAWPDHRKEADKYAHKGGAVFRDRKTAPTNTRLLDMFVDFHTMVVRDGIDPQVAHTALLAIDEYSKRIPSDIKGARA